MIRHLISFLICEIFFLNLLSLRVNKKKIKSKRVDKLTATFRDRKKLAMPLSARFILVRARYFSLFNTRLRQELKCSDKIVSGMISYP